MPRIAVLAVLAVVVAAAVVTSLRGTPEPAGAEADLLPPVRPEARRLYERAQQRLRDLDLAGSTLLHDSAIAVDSSYAEGYAGLAESDFLGGFFGVVPRPLAWSRARAEAQTALAHDSALADAHAVLGYIALYDDWDWERAEAELGTAVRLDRNDVLARHGYADLLSFQGRAHEGLEHVKLALEADPSSVLTNGIFVGHLYAAGDYEGILEKVPRIRELLGDSSFAADLTASTLWMTGRFHEAVEEYRRAWRADEVLILEDVLPREGPALAMRAVADHAAARWQPGDGSALIVARCYALAGADDEVFTWLERAYEERRPQLLHATVFPEFDRLRLDPRYAQMMDRFGLGPPP